MRTHNPHFKTSSTVVIFVVATTFWISNAMAAEQAASTAQSSASTAEKSTGQTSSASMVDVLEERANELNIRFEAGEYAAVGARGLAWLRSEDPAPESPLRLKIAHSLAWTNRLDEAIDLYERLVRNSDQFQEARLPLASAYRWSGRTDLAIPIYTEVLEEDETAKDALEGMEYAQRDIRPRTTIDWGRGQDSGELTLNTATITHRWRDPSMQQIYTVEGTLRDHNQAPLNQNTRYTGISFQYEHVALPYQPRLSLSMKNQPSTGIFGSARVKLGNWPVYAEVAHENFAFAASSAKAMNLGLKANRLSLESKWSGEIGSMTGKMNISRISDNNTLSTANLKLTPNWRPVGPKIQPFVSVETRKTDFYTANYWSPEDGFGSVSVGATAEWSEKDWMFFAGGQLGTRLYGEAGTSSWSASMGGQRWIDRDTAITVNLWAMSSVRDSAKYRANSLNMSIDRLWR